MITINQNIINKDERPISISNFLNNRKYFNADERSFLLECYFNKKNELDKARRELRNIIKKQEIKNKEMLTTYFEMTDLSSVAYEKRLAVILGLKLLSETGQLNMTKFLEKNNYSFTYANSVIHNYIKSSYYFTGEELINAFKSLFI